MEDRWQTLDGDVQHASEPFELWLQALTTLELAEAHFGPRRSAVVDMFHAAELAARLALKPTRPRLWH